MVRSSKGTRRIASALSIVRAVVLGFTLCVVHKLMMLCFKTYHGHVEWRNPFNMGDFWEAEQMEQDTDALMMKQSFRRLGDVAKNNTTGRKAAPSKTTTGKTTKMEKALGPDTFVPSMVVPERSDSLLSEVSTFAEMPCGSSHITHAIKGEGDPNTGVNPVGDASKNDDLGDDAADNLGDTTTDDASGDTSGNSGDGADKSGNTPNDKADHISGDASNSDLGGASSDNKETTEKSADKDDGKTKEKPFSECDIADVETEKSESGMIGSEDDLHPSATSLERLEAFEDSRLVIEEGLEFEKHVQGVFTHFLNYIWHLINKPILQPKEEDEEEEKEIEIPNYIYAIEVLLVIFLSLLFEYGQDHLKESLESGEKEVALDIMDTTFGELTVLGFIGLGVYILTKTGFSVDLAERVFPTYHAEDGPSPLSESFENVHVVIFCVMMVFIFQACLLMGVAEELTRYWTEWELVTPTGEKDSLESELVRQKYLNADMTMNRKFSPGDFKRRLWNVFGLKQLMVWHSIRHCFLYPPYTGPDDKGMPVRDPASFDFQMYLTKKMGSLFVQMVEVNYFTWGMAAVLVFPIACGATGEHPPQLEYLSIAQFSSGAFIVGCFWLLLIDMTRVELEITPQLSKDASKFILPMRTMYKKVHRQNSSVQTQSMNVDEIGEPAERIGRLLEEEIEKVQKNNVKNTPADGKKGRDDDEAEIEKLRKLKKELDEEREQNPMGNRTTAKALFAPIHLRAMDRMKVEESLKKESEEKKQEVEEYKRKIRATQAADLHDQQQIKRFRNTIAVEGGPPRSPRMTRRMSQRKHDVYYQVRQEELKKELLAEKEGAEGRSASKAETKEPPGWCNIFGKTCALVAGNAEKHEAFVKDSSFAGKLLRVIIHPIKTFRSVKHHITNMLNKYCFKRKRPLIILLLGGDEHYIPNEHDQLFYIQELGIAYYEQALQTLSFMQSWLVASLIVVLCVATPNTILQWTLFLANIPQWPYQINMLLPRVIRKFCIISSIEQYKDLELIKKVTFEVKQRRLRRAIDLMKMGRAEARLARLAGNSDKVLSEERFEECLDSFENLPHERQFHVEATFLNFDFEQTGVISCDNLERVLSAMKVGGGKDLSVLAHELVALVDINGDGTLDLEEFKVLMMLAYEGARAGDDTEFLQFFNMIDVDGDGSLTPQELSHYFRRQLNVPLSASDIGTLMYNCFHEVKADLNCDDFIKWMNFLSCEEEGGGGKSEHKPSVPAEGEDRSKRILSEQKGKKEKDEVFFLPAAIPEDAVLVDYTDVPKVASSSRKMGGRSGSSGLGDTSNSNSGDYVPPSVPITDESENPLSDYRNQNDRERPSTTSDEGTPTAGTPRAVPSSPVAVPSSPRAANNKQMKTAEKKPEGGKTPEMKHQDARPLQKTASGGKKYSVYQI